MVFAKSVLKIDLFNVLRIFPVEFPMQRVVQDIFPDAIQFVHAPDHVFVKRALPQMFIERTLSAFLHSTKVFVGGHGFEPLNNFLFHRCVSRRGALGRV
jgi:hypothetical protein